MKALYLFLILIVTSCSTIAAEPTLSEKVGRMIIVGMPGVEINSKSVIVEDITKRKIGGVILFESNVVTAEEKKLPAEELAKIDFKARLTKLCSELQALADYPLIISIDQEGGVVNRLKERYGFVPSVVQELFGDRDDESFTRRYARSAASQLRDIGINTNFAPCVDVNINPECPAIGRHGRAISADVDMVVRHARYIMEEHHNKGIVTAIKHFPGHGSSLDDTHLGITDVTSTWQQSELTPYKQLLNKEGVKNNMVMVSHVFNSRLDPKYPATLSHKIINDLLRTEIGWQGVVVTDDMHMKAITDHYSDSKAMTLTINAGTDMIILSSNLPTKHNEHVTDSIINIIVEQVKSGAISEQRINEAYGRIVALEL